MAKPSVSPPRWTREQLEQDRRQAIEDFRKLRVEEPLEDYLEVFENYQGRLEDLLELTVDLTRLGKHA